MKTLKIGGYTIRGNKIECLNAANGYNEIIKVADAPAKAIYSCGYYSVIIKLADGNRLSDLEFDTRELAQTAINYLIDAGVSIMGKE